MIKIYHILDLIKLINQKTHPWSKPTLGTQYTAYKPLDSNTGSSVLSIGLAMDG